MGDARLAVILQALAGLVEGQARIEAKLDALLEAMAEEADEQSEGLSLDDRSGGYPKSAATTLS